MLYQVVLCTLTHSEKQDVLTSTTLAYNLRKCISYSSSFTPTFRNTKTRQSRQSNYKMLIVTSLNFIDSALHREGQTTAVEMAVKPSEFQVVRQVSITTITTVVRIVVVWFYQSLCPIAFLQRWQSLRHIWMLGCTLLSYNT